MIKPKPRVGLAVIRHPLEEGGENAPAMLDQARRALAAAGLDVVAAPVLIEDHASSVTAGRYFYDQRVPLLVVAAATWSADSNLLDLLEECGVPVVTWAWPGMNTGSMCGCQQFCYVLKELGRPCKYVFGSADDAEAIAGIRRFAAAINLAAELRKTRLALVGYRVPGMTEVAFDEVELKRLLGPRTIHYGIEDVQRMVAEVSESQAMQTWHDRWQHVGKTSVGQSEILDSMRGYLALKQLVERDGLAGLAVECYPAFMGRLCVAGSMLADEGVVVGCEADMNATVAMSILSRLTGQPVHNTDGLGVDLDEGWMVFSHCGNGSTKLAEAPGQVEVAHVRLAHKGACVLFPGKTGEVTLINLVGSRGTYRMGIAHGRAVPTEMVFAGNPTKVVLDGGVRQYMDTVAGEGLGHHWIISYGDVRVELEEFCRYVGLTAVQCTP